MTEEIEWAKESIKKAVERSRVVRRERRDGTGFYNYIILPFEDVLDGELSEAIAIAMDAAVDSDRSAQMIFTPEAKGTVAADCYRDWLRYRHSINVPVNYIRKRHYGTEGEILIHRGGNAYGEAASFSIKSIPNGIKARFVDDITSTGETLTAVINGVKKQNVKLDYALLVFERAEGRGYIEQKTGVPVRSVARIDVKGGAEMLKPCVEKFYI